MKITSETLLRLAAGIAAGSITEEYVRENYAGYEAQCRRWWFPVWRQLRGHYGTCNTHNTLESAEQWCRKHESKVVKLLGKLQ